MQHMIWIVRRSKHKLWWKYRARHATKGFGAHDYLACNSLELGPSNISLCSAGITQVLKYIASNWIIRGDWSFGVSSRKFVLDKRKPHGLNIWPNLGCQGEVAFPISTKFFYSLSSLIITFLRFEELQSKVREYSLLLQQRHCSASCFSTFDLLGHLQRVVKSLKKFYKAV